MQVAGIVAEYNPFHLGHGWHIAETKRLLGGDAGIVCVMSGNFVQRGQAAVADKWLRAECALLGGADLVLELPTVWAAASAEAFAQGAVTLLAATGVVDVLSFGCESGDATSLSAAADCLLTDAHRALLREELSRGVSFPAARQAAAERLIGPAAGCLSTPNNNLAVEYLKALTLLRSSITPLAVSRVGAGHDAAAPAGGFASASAVRTMLHEGRWEEAGRYLPQSTASLLAQAAEPGRCPAGLEQCERAVLARLRTMDESAFATLPDSGSAEGLPRRLTEAARTSCSIEAFCAAAKTKRYTHARIRRLVLWAFLGLTAADRPAAPPYLRVLGFNRRGQALLRDMGERASLPILVKSAHARRLPQPARRLFELEARCTDLYALCSPLPRPCGLEWTNGPVILDI
ncbi:nucleotidyltransferase family protein [Pseudoflavonifractor sp. CLA-AP-H29]|uniref:tRNA(Met) cytidine acetate ligase n=1 Tax=Pseudoflavonifractor intestinihominis TaxID=3133171 RepID=A0ABV1E8D7_9FIRM